MLAAAWLRTDAMVFFVSASRGEDGEIVDGGPMTPTLSCEHRILHGVDGAEYPAEVGRLPEEPIGLPL
ncbi:MAG: hypothetical protein J0H06_04685 [Actinobacteria bacterium]|nr:hypothetical protein [Actinomycetota bacterium]